MDVLKTLGAVLLFFFVLGLVAGSEERPQPTQAACVSPAELARLQNELALALSSLRARND